MRWGLIPFWAKDRSIGSRMINARAETVVDKPSFRDAFRRRRCLVLGRSSLADAREKIEAWRRYYNAEPPDGALGNLAPKTFPLKTPAVVR